MRIMRTLIGRNCMIKRNVEIKVRLSRKEAETLNKRVK